MSFVKRLVAFLTLGRSCAVYRTWAWWCALERDEVAHQSKQCVINCRRSTAIRWDEQGGTGRRQRVRPAWIEESPDALGGAKRFSTLDLASGYNQVHVAEKEKAKCIRHPIWILWVQSNTNSLFNAARTFKQLIVISLSGHFCCILTTLLSSQPPLKVPWHATRCGVISHYKPFWISVCFDITGGRVHLDFDFDL